MLRILNENTFYNESQKLKDILIINKYLNKAKYLIHNMPQFLCTIIEEFELTESNFHEHMYLFILLAINKWFKRVCTYKYIQVYLYVYFICMIHFFLGE